MLVSQFNFNLPQNLIAQKPAKPRDSSRLLILNRRTGQIIHEIFNCLDKYLQAGDILVFNNSKVIPARLIGRKESGGQIEVFLLRKLRNNFWEVLIRGRAVIGQKIMFDKNTEATIIKKNWVKQNTATYQVKFNAGDKKIFSLGQTPLPPYIKKSAKPTDYQTVYAKIDGSVAAPTAGLHFTKRLLKKLIRRGVKIEYVTLHVGLGTFAPVKSKRVEDHHLHSELAILDRSTARRLNQAKKNGRRVIAVGTTSARTLEALTDKSGKLKPQKKWVNIFIYPGYKFKFINALVTNFHLPKSSLIMLVAAFAGRKQIIQTYQTAIKKKYRFYSFGDGMLIL